MTHSTEWLGKQKTREFWITNRIVEFWSKADWLDKQNSVVLIVHGWQSWSLQSYLREPYRSRYVMEGRSGKVHFEFNATTETDGCTSKTRCDGNEDEGDHCLFNTARFGVGHILWSVGPDGKEPVGLHGNLLDENGFPRDDIDLWKVCNIRYGTI